MKRPLSPAELGFTKRDQQRLARALRTETDARTVRRLQAVRLVAEGDSLAEAAHLTGFSPRSLYRFIRRYLSAHQTAALSRRQTRRPPGTRPANHSGTHPAGVAAPAPRTWLPDQRLDGRVAGAALE
jgi:hypothetical protein